MAAWLEIDLDTMLLAWPLGDSMLEDLRWYLEDYLTVPFGVYEDRGGWVQARLADWGRAVFTFVFGPDATIPGDVQVVLRSASALLLALPWELMAAPGHAQPLALEVAGLSRSSLPVADETEAVPVPGGRLRVLMVISRPDGTGDVGYRMIARPLLKRLEAVRGAVDLIVLRPPTLDALRAELEAAAAAGKPYQVVHFDGHGDMEILGGEGVLVFERSGGGGHRVRAAAIAEVLGAARVPVVVLNACQSGAVGKNLEAAVATALLEAGVASVVAMAYTVYAVAAAEFMTAFYNRLFGGGTVSSAVTAGRQQMFGRPGRPSPKGEVPLQDWIVPVHYLRRDVSFPQAQGLATGDGPGRLPAGDGPAGVGDLDPVDGVFIGRDALFYDLEVAARTQRAVVLTGLGGTGKTELAKAFGRWWRDTGAVEQPEWVFWHSFEPGRASFGLDAVINEIGMRRFGMQFAAQDDKVKRRDRVLDFLTGHRALLIWDNFESVRSLPDPARATPALDDEGGAELHDFLAQLMAHGTTPVLITSRAPEEWLGDVLRLPVGGLAQHEAVEYADHLLSQCPQAQARRGRRDFGDLMQWLDGHPLCLRLVLPQLADTAPAALLAKLRETAPSGRDTGPDADRTGSLAACVSYSYAHLSEATRRLLPLLSLSQGVVDIIILAVASDDPDIPPRFAGATADDWVSAVEEAVRVGLLTRPWDSTEDDYFGLFLIHPALPGYLASTWCAESPAEYDAAREAATRVLVQAHATRCRQALDQLGSGADGRIFARVEWVRHNLRSFLGYALDNGMWTDAAAMEELLEKFWDAWGLEAERDAWVDRIAVATQAPDGSAPLLDTPAGDLWWKTSTFLALWRKSRGQVDQAERSFRRILAAIEQQEPSPELNRCLALLYRDLGEIAEKRGDLEQARSWQDQALAVQDEPDGEAAGEADFWELANAAEARGDLAAAEDLYQKSLASNESAGNQSAMARDCLTLGTVAMGLGRYEEAGTWFSRALGISQARGDLYDSALACGILGSARFFAGSPDEGEEYLRRAITLAESIGSPPLLMQPNLKTLGLMARQRGRLAEADGWYRRLLASAEAAGTRQEIAAVYETLGAVARDDGRSAGAIDWYLKAAEIYGELEDHLKATETRAEIGRIAGAAGQSLSDQIRASGLRILAGRTGVGVGPLWAGLWHPIGGLRSVEIQELLDPNAEQRGQADVAISVAAADPDRAERIAAAMTDQSWKTEALVGMATALAGRDADRAEQIALSIPGDFPKARALAGIAGMAAAAFPARFARIATQAENIARSIPQAYPRAEALVAVAAALAARDPDRAEQIGQTLPGPSQARALANVAAVVVAADPDRAIRLIAAAELSARSLEAEGVKAEGLAGIAAALSGIDPGNAERVAQSISPEESYFAPQAEALAAVALGLVDTEPDRAERIAQSIAHEYLRERTLAAIALAFAATDPDRADRIARSITHRGWRAEILAR